MTKAVIYDMTPEPVHLKGVVGRQWRVTLNVAGAVWQYHDWEAHITAIPREPGDVPVVIFAVSVTVVAAPAGVDLVLEANSDQTSNVIPGEYYWDLVYTGQAASPEAGVGPQSLIGGPVTVEEGPTQ